MPLINIFSWKKLLILCISGVILFFIILSQGPSFDRNKYRLSNLIKHTRLLAENFKEKEGRYPKSLEELFVFDESFTEKYYIRNDINGLSNFRYKFIFDLLEEDLLLILKPSKPSLGPSYRSYCSIKAKEIRINRLGASIKTKEDCLNQLILEWKLDQKKQKYGFVESEPT